MKAFSEYAFLDLISFGGSGCVLKVQDRTTGKVYALKITALFEPHQLDEFKREGVLGVKLGQTNPFFGRTIGVRVSTSVPPIFLSMLETECKLLVAG